VQLGPFRLPTLGANRCADGVRDQFIERYSRRFSYGYGLQGARRDPISPLRIAYSVSATRSRMCNFLNMLFR
jgi:hypothetical protein